MLFLERKRKRYSKLRETGPDDEGIGIVNLAYAESLGRGQYVGKGKGLRYHFESFQS